jgi:hypothetical protein
MLRIMSGALCIVVCLGLLGCNRTADKKGSTTPSAGGGDSGAKLAKDIIGTWEKDKVAYTFKEGGDYEYKGGDLTIKGKWKAVDDKHIEMTFNLTKADVEALKPFYETTKKGVEAANEAIKAMPVIPGAPKIEPIAAPPEPKEGDNTWKEQVTVSGSTAKISGVEYKKK